MSRTLSKNIEKESTSSVAMFDDFFSNQLSSDWNNFVLSCFWYVSGISGNILQVITKACNSTIHTTLKKCIAMFPVLISDSLLYFTSSLFPLSTMFWCLHKIIVSIIASSTRTYFSVRSLITVASCMLTKSWLFSITFKMFSCNVTPNTWSS